jgi:hypothetical protein
MPAGETATPVFPRGVLNKVYFRVSVGEDIRMNVAGSQIAESVSNFGHYNAI